MNRKKTTYLIGAMLLLAVCMAAVYFFSAQNGGQSARLSQRALQWIELYFPQGYALLQQHGRPEYLLRKLAHFTEYALLGVVSCFLLKRRLPFGKSAGGAVLFCFLFAVTDEVHQLFVPGRDGNITDVCIDTAGAAAGVLLYGLVFAVLHLLKGRESAGNTGESI